ncbi:hypothetical protein EOL70_16835 [Leucothrix sargassi]|nr:hypothetical protein EOL70_16835 [Leucothrix sargassi]
MKYNEKYKLFYIHTPKTAGSSVNEYFNKIFKNKSIFHIEGQLGRAKSFDINNFDFASGHISYDRAKRILDNRWLKIITLREPYSFVISHLCWIRLLADSDQKERFNRHPEIIQKVAKKMLDVDFSDSNQITSFIAWLESIDYLYLHNTQTFYLDIKKRVDYAKKALKDIEFVGTLEELDDFLNMVNNQLNLNSTYSRAPRENVNTRKYGLDINDEKIRKALFPLIDKDILLYKEASKIFSNDLLSYHSSFSPESIKGYIDFADEKSIQGWAMSDDSTKHLRLELYVNDSLKLETLANKFRFNLKAKKIHKTGLAEFCFDLSDLVIMPKDEIVIKESYSGKRLTAATKAKSSFSALHYRIL